MLDVCIRFVFDCGFQNQENKDKNEGDEGRFFFGSISGLTSPRTQHFRRKEAGLTAWSFVLLFFPGADVRGKTPGLGLPGGGENTFTDVLRKQSSSAWFSSDSFSSFTFFLFFSLSV